MPVLTRKPRAALRPDPANPRKLFDETELLALGESLKVRQNEPLQAKPDGTIIDGERRWRAAGLVGLAELDVIVTDTALTLAETQVIRLTGFFHRQGLTAPEQTDAVAELLKLNAGWTNKDVAACLHVDASSITRLLSPLRCVPEVLAAYRALKIGLSDAYAISKLPNDDQPAALAMKLSGASRDQLEAHGRKVRNGAAPAVKQARVSVPLTTGTKIVVSGPEMSLQDLIEALTQALEAARKANRDQLDVKTAEKVWRDKAKAGSGHV